MSSFTNYSQTHPTFGATEHPNIELHRVLSKMFEIRGDEVSVFVRAYFEYVLRTACRSQQRSSTFLEVLVT